MRIEVTQSDLIKPLQMVCNVVDRKQTMQVLGNILCFVEGNKLKLTGTDAEVQIDTEVEVNVDSIGKTTIPANKIISICKNLNSDASIKLEAEGQKAILRSGRSRFSLSTLPADDYPGLTDINPDYSISIPQNKLKQLIERTSFAMAHQDVRFFLNGLMFEFSSQFLKAVAADGHRLSYSEIEIDNGPMEVQQIIVPRKGIVELQRLLDSSEDQVTIEVSSNHLRVIFSESLV